MTRAPSFRPHTLSMNRNIAFIGAGLMGSGMARSLIRKGFSPGLAFEVVRSALHSDDLLE